MISLHMTGSVGQACRNVPNDVCLIKALLNAFARKQTKTVLPMNDKVDAAFLTLLEDFQKSVVKMARPDSKVTANAGTFKKLVEQLKLGFTTTSITPPTKGVLTWNAEGNEGGDYHSRILHVPSANSGLTIGRGYDLGGKTAGIIESELLRAGLAQPLAQKLALASRKRGKVAERFVIDNDLLDLEIAPSVQLALFKIAYAFQESEVFRLSKKGDTVAQYGAVDWPALPGKLLELVVDLKFRGDYTPNSRTFLQKELAQGNIAAVKTIMASRTLWPNVPVERFNARAKFAASIPLPAVAGVNP